jgi:tetratricopeptide (TPR) repeat protein
MSLIPSTVSFPDDAVRWSAEAQYALGRGDTATARSLHEQAGKALEVRVSSARKPADKNVYRFLAASQYYRGGHYQAALEVCRKIQADLLPEEVRHLYEPFWEDVRDRSSPGYETRIRKLLYRHLQKKEYDHALTLLKDHHYLLNAGDTAFLRAICCEHLRDYHAAALFFADAVKSFPNDPGMHFYLAALPLSLNGEGKRAEAWEYVEHLLRAVPHAVVSLTAALVRFGQAADTGSRAEQERLCQDQVSYFEQGRRLFRELPPQLQSDPNLRNYMTLCFEGTALGLQRWGDQNRALELCNEAIRFNPIAPGPRALRGSITYPSVAAIEDCHEAIRLGENSYTPYYFLAHAALARGAFGEAILLCEQALSRRPSQKIEAQMHAWIALSNWRLGASPDVVQQRFERASNLDPENSDISSHLAAFKAASPPPSFTLDRNGGVWAVISEQEQVERDSRQLAKRGQASGRQRELATVSG